MANLNKSNELNDDPNYRPPQPLALFASVGFLDRISGDFFVRKVRRCFIWNPNKIVPLQPPKLDKKKEVDI